MSLRRIPAPVLLGIAALGPIALGVAAHIEHMASQRHVLVDAPPVIVPVVQAVEVPVEVPVEAPAEVEPVEVEPAEVKEELEYGDDFLFVTDIGGPHVVLSLEVDDAWAEGRFRHVDGVWGAVRRKVDADALPEHLRGWSGRKVVLHDSENNECTAVVGRSKIVAQYDGELDLLLDDPPDDFWDAERLPKVLFKPVWKEGRRLLVAPVTIPEQCGDPTWAQPVGTPAPLVRTRDDDAGTNLTEAVKMAVLALPDIETLAKDILEEIEPGDGPATPLSEQTLATAWHDPDGTTSVVSVAIDGESFYMCGGWDERWAVATIRDGKVDHLETGSLATVDSVLDLERDGTSEIITTGTRMDFEAELSSVTADGLQVRYTLPSVPFIGCPC